MTARNAVAGFAGRFGTLAVGLAIAPYLLLSLGTDRFGVWALVTVLTGGLGLLDLSVRVPLVKFLADETPEQHSAVASSGLVLAALVAAGIAVAFALVRNPFLDWMAVPEAIRGEATDTFTIGAAGLLAMTVLSVYPALCDARERMDVTNALGLASLALGTALTVAAVQAGHGLRGVALAQLVAIVVFHGSAIVASRRLAPAVRVDPRLATRAWMRRLAGFGGRVHTGRACGVVAREFDKFLLAHWSGLPATAAYEIGLKLVSAGGTLVWFLSAALLPATSRLSAPDRARELVDLHRRSLRYLSLLACPMFAFVTLEAGPLIEAWTGTTLPSATATVMLLAAGYLASALVSGMVHVAQGIGLPGLHARQGALQLTTNVILSVGLYRLLGPLGAPLGTSLALVLGAAFLATRLHQALGLSTPAVVRECVAAPMLCAGAAALVTRAAPMPGLAPLAALAAAGVLFSAVYAACGLAWGCIDAGEIRRLVRTARRPTRSLSGSRG